MLESELSYSTDLESDYDQKLKDLEYCQEMIELFAKDPDPIKRRQRYYDIKEYRRNGKIRAMMTFLLNKALSSGDFNGEVLIQWSPCRQRLDIYKGNRHKIYQCHKKCREVQVQIPPEYYNDLGEIDSSDSSESN